MFWLFYLSLVIKLAFITLYDSPWSAEWQDRSIVKIQRTQVLQSSANLRNSIPAQIQCLCYSSCLSWGLSCVKEKITRSIVPSGILGNSANKLFVHRLLLFRYPVHLLNKKKERKQQIRTEKGIYELICFL